jgi:hypothetical protein
MYKGIVFDAPEMIEVIGPLIFLAGPIQGAPPWHNEAISILHELDEGVCIASPCRRKIKLDRSSFSGPSKEFTSEMYNEQVDWETHHLNRAAKDGVVLFWLAKEENHICTRAYAQTSRFELGEWKERSRWINMKLVVGIQKGFTNERYLRRRLAQDCPNIQTAHTLEETCMAAIQLIRR